MKPTYGDLYFAIINGNHKEFEEMLQQKPPLDTKFIRGATLVSHALYKKHDKILACLVKAGANPNIRTRDNKMEPPLFTACRMNNFEGLQILLTSPTLDINQRDFFNRTALWAAVRYRMYNGAKLLLDHGADINIAEIALECPLHLAIEWFNPIEWQSLAHLLIRRGCFLTCKSSQEFALQCAVWNNDRKSFRLLILSENTLNVKNTSEFHTFPEAWLADVEFCEWLKSKTKTPLPLLHLSKNVIRYRLATSRKNVRFQDVNQLRLPANLKLLIMLVDDCFDKADIEEFTSLSVPSETV